MSCRNLEVIITELARGQMLDARVKEDALAHMEGCKHCSARFADEQTLTAGLRAVATSAASMEAPARVEGALLSAFRQQTATPFQPIVAPARNLKPRWIPLSIAAAAAILIISALAVQFMPSNNSRVPAQNQASTNQPASVPTETLKDSDPIGQGDGPETAVNDSDQKSDDMQPSPRMINRRRDFARNVGLSRGQVSSANNFGTTANAERESTTEFLPLTYGSNLAQIEDGQVVRVELPRSALQSFGFPVNAERAGERVKADVLLGHDGVARAIRFVR